MKKLFIPLLALGMGTTLTAQADTWKFASEEAKGDVQDIYAQTFAEVIEEESDGDIRVRISPLSGIVVSRTKSKIERRSLATMRKRPACSPSVTS